MKLPSVATLADYGGPKVNDAPIENPTTDESADERNQYVEDVAGMTQTAGRAWVRFVGVSSGNPTDPASNVHGAVWGNDADVKPTVARSSTGVYVVTWPTTVTDDLNQAHTVSIRGAHRPNVESSTLYHTQVQLTSANSVTVRVFNTSSTANDAVGATISVMVW